MKLYRVFPYDPSAAETDPGGALYVPPPSPLGRIANSSLYRERYFSDCREGAVSEVFGHLTLWTDVDFVHANGLRFHVSEFDLNASLPIFDLDDVAALAAIGITKPSVVVTRKRAVTQAWAATIFHTASYAGARWWSYYYPGWFSFGLWDHRGLRHVGPPEPLSPTHPAVITAARTIVRQLR